MLEFNCIESCERFIEPNVPLIRDELSKFEPPSDDPLAAARKASKLVTSDRGTERWEGVRDENKAKIDEEKVDA